GRWRRARRVEPRASETARSGTAEAAGTRAARAPGSARPRAETARTRAAGAAIFARTGFADGQRAAVEHLPVELLYRFFGVGAILKLHERESAWAAGLAIDWQHHLRGCRNATEVASQVGFCGAVGEVSNEQADGQAVLSVAKNLTRNYGVSQAGAIVTVMKRALILVFTGVAL